MKRPLKADDTYTLGEHPLAVTAAQVAGLPAGASTFGRGEALCGWLEDAIEELCPADGPPADGARDSVRHRRYLLLRRH